MLAALGACCATFAQPAEATLLQAFRSPGGTSQSFWDPLNWLPQQVPGPGDTLRITNAAGGSGLSTMYLGDVPGFAGRTVQVSRLHLDSSGSTLNWGSSSGGQPGGLRFSQDDPTDSGVGIRVARSINNGGQGTNIIDAQNAPADAFRLVVGTLDPLISPQINRLSLIASSILNVPTLNLTALFLDGSNSTLDVGQNVNVSLLRVSNREGNQVYVGYGLLDVESAFFGGGGLPPDHVPLQVKGLGIVSIDSADLAASGPASQATILVGDSAPFDSGGTANFANLTVSVLDESRATILADGGAGPSVGWPWPSLAIGGVGAEVSHSTLEFIARNGGTLSVTNGVIDNLDLPGPGVPSVIRILADGPGSTLRGSFTVNGGGGTLEVSNRAMWIAEDTVPAFVDRIKILAAAQVGNETLARIRTINAPATAVAATSVNVGANYHLVGGLPVGGDLPALGGAHLELGGGAQVRIGAGPIPGTESPLLAIGSKGVVTLGPAAAVYIGDPAATPNFQPGMIVVDPGGNLCGTGLVNGTGFPVGVHPDVFNLGGNVHPGFSPGTLSIDGRYIQEFGTLTLEIAGANAGEFDVLDASQGVDFIGGTLRFVRLNNFVPVEGTQFDFFAGRDVLFDPSLVIEDNTGFGLELDPATGIVTVPEPSTALSLAMGCVGLVWSGRRPARSTTPPSCSSRAPS